MLQWVMGYGYFAQGLPAVPGAARDRTKALGRDGELLASSAVTTSGTVTRIAVGSNLVSQPSPITVTGSIGLSPTLSVSCVVA